MTKVIDWIKSKSNDKFQFMSLIGGAFVFIFLTICLIQTFELNLLFKNSRIDVENYERLSMHYTNRIFEIVSLVFLYFFRTPNDRHKEEITVQDKEDAPKTQKQFFDSLDKK